MQTLPWKKITLGVVALVAVLAGVLYFKNAQSLGTSTTTINPSFGEYI